MKPSSKIFILIIFTVSLMGFIAFSNRASAGTAAVSWNANTESDLAGYKIYYGVSPRTGTDPKVCGLCGYSSKVDVGNVTSYLFSNLTNGLTYYFSVSAYDTSSNESVFSIEKSKLITATATADLNADGRVNSVDFGIMMSNWNSTAKPKSDINQDGIVNSVDFGILMSQWTG